MYKSKQNIDIVITIHREEGTCKITICKLNDSTSYLTDTHKY